MNQKKTLTAENLNYISLTKSCCIIDYFNVFAKDRHSLLCGFIYQNLPNTRLLLDSRWFNLDKRCDVMVGSSAISMEQLQEFQLSSCHMSLFTSSCQILDFYLTPTNPMQPPFLGGIIQTRDVMSW